MAGDSRAVEQERSATGRGQHRRNYPPQGLTRRDLLKLGGKAAVAAVGVALAVKQAVDFEQGTKRAIEGAAGDIKGILGGEATNSETVELSSQTPKERVPQTELSKRVLTDFDLAYPNLGISDRAGAWEETKQAQLVMMENLSYEHFKQIAGHEALIRKSASDANMPENLLLGLVITESKGDPFAVSGAGAKGLTQIMDETAKELEIKIYEGEGNERDDERYIPEIVLPKSAQALRNEYDRFGDWGLALWSWHAGDPAIYRAIRTYCSEALSIELPDIKVVEADESDEAKAAAIEEVTRRKKLYQITIAENGVNLFKLFQNETIKQMFSGPQWDKTEEYVPRIIASSLVYNGNKALV